jgi:phosphate transport system protein
MTRESLDRQMHQVQDEVLLLGSMVEQATIQAMNAFKTHDLKAARLIYSHDQLINEKRYAIENAILILMATQQPAARDLRELAAYLEVTGELERMGDYAKGTCKVLIQLGDAPMPLPTTDFEQMAELAVSMLHDALSAFVAENPMAASQIPQRDDQVDELYLRIYHALVNAMIANPEVIDHANHLMWVAHNLERLADRVTNICERTVFIATGELLEFEPTSDDEDTVIGPRE